MVLVGKDLFEVEKSREEVEITKENAQEYYEKAYNALINADYFTIERSDEYDTNYFYLMYSSTLKFAANPDGDAYLATTVGKDKKDKGKPLGKQPI